MSERHRQELLRVMSSLGFWLVVTDLVVLIVLGLAVVSGRHADRALRTAAREDATRSAEAQTQYQTCIQSIPTTRRINGFVNGIQDITVTLFQNALATHRATPPTDHAYKTQIANIERLRNAVLEVTAVASFPVPTKAECAARRDARVAAQRPAP